MIRKVLPFASNYLKKSNLKKSVSRFAKTSLFSTRFNTKAFASLATTYSFKFSTSNAGLNLNNTPQGSNIVEITTIESFQKIMKEATQPVVLDCYAHWCEPCKKLTPILEEKARQNEGKWILAKFDIDSIPQLATALKLRSVPTVILIHNGNAIDTFEGMPTDQVFETFFGTLEKLSGLGYSPEQHQTIFNEAIGHLNNKNFAEAIKLLKHLLESEHWIEGHGALTTAALSLAYIKSGDKNASVQALQDLSAKYEQDLEQEQVKSIVQEIQKEFDQKAAETSKLEEMKLKLESDPANNDLRVEIAQYAIDNGSYEQAIETLLDIMKIDRNFKDRIANKLLLDIFGKLGATNPLVVQGRKKMQRILF